MESATPDKETGAVVIQFSGGGEGRFPYVWLRDNCQCNECFHPVSRARLFLLRKLDPNIEPASIKIESGNELVITWPDKHKSQFNVTWLRSHMFNDDVREEEEKSLHRAERLWTSKQMNGNIPQVNFKELMEDDEMALKWLLHLEQDGICLVVEGPQSKGVVRQICNRIAYPKKNFYGEIFQVETKVNPNNVAYTSACLGLHTDQPQLNYTPGVQLLHCVKQAAEGGDNIFADGFQVAQDLQKQHPESFRILRETPVTYADAGIEGKQPFQMKTKMYTIECDVAGKLTKINYNNQIRSSLMTIPFDQVKPFYESLTQYESMLMDPKYCIRHKLNPGDVVCFHNYRVMHGREEYQITGDGSRLLEGGYIDWDEMLSTRRVLETKVSRD